MVKLFNCFYSEVQSPYLLHYHNAHEVIYVKSGCVEFTINQKTYLVHSGNLVFISSLEEHKTHIVRGPYLRYYILITTNQLAMLLDDLRLRSVFLSHPVDFVHVFPVKDIQPQVEELFISMTQEFEEQYEFQEKMLAVNFTQLMILCYRLNPSYFSRSTQKINPILLEIQRHIDSHLSEKMAIGDLAEQFYLSESYLSHSFKAWTGHSPQRYLILNRISLAKELLSRYDMPISSISLRCGFGTPSQFISCFKKETGITPGKFHKIHYQPNF